MGHRTLTVRLHRAGRKHYQLFRVVVTFNSKRNRGFFFESLGFYNPQKKERLLLLNINRLGFWLNKGACYNLKFMHKLYKLCL